MENPVDCPKVIPNMTNLKLFCVAPCQVLQLLPPQPNCKGYNFPCCYTQYNSNSSFLTATKHGCSLYNSLAEKAEALLLYVVPKS